MLQELLLKPKFIRDSASRFDLDQGELGMFNMYSVWIIYNNMHIFIKKTVIFCLDRTNIKKS